MGCRQWSGIGGEFDSWPAQQSNASATPWGKLIGKDVASVIQDVASAMKFAVVDPFAGSCNSLYWILRHVRNSKGIAFEIDRTIFEVTKQNLASLAKDIELVNGDYPEFRS